MKFSSKYNNFHSKKCDWICHLENGGHFSYASLGVWNDGNSWNQTLTICRVFQSCISNYSQQEKLEYSEYIFVTFTKFLLWVNLWYFGTWIRVAARAKCGRQTMRIQIRSHCYSSSLRDYIKTHGLISTKNMVRHSAKCVLIVCKVTGVSAVWNLHNGPATFSWLRPAS